MLRNQLNGLEVITEIANNGPQDHAPRRLGYVANVFTDTVWDDTDLTYILRATDPPGRLRAANGPAAPALPAFPHRQLPARAEAVPDAHDPEQPARTACWPTASRSPGPASRPSSSS